MAETFSINTGDAVQQSPGPAAQATPVQIQAAATPGGISNAAAPDTAFNSATTDALLKLGSDILAPKIKEAQQTQFMNGVQRVMQGEAVKDIVNEQPWYTEIFGPSSAVQGARAYTVAQQVAQFGATMESKMPILAQQGPEAITAQAQGLMNDLKTGDATADAAIMAQTVDQLAPLYKRHAKEHYLYQQNRASDAQVGTWGTLGDAYQERATASKDPTKPVSAMDLEADKARFIGSLSKFGDQTDESYNKNITRFLSAAAEKGNMHVVKMFQDEGFIAHLPPEDQAALAAKFRAGGRIALDKTIPQFGLDMAIISHDMTQNPRLVPQKIAALNARAAEVTGVPVEVAQLLPNGHIDNIQGSILTAQQHQAQQAAVLAQKAEMEATQVKIAGTLIQNTPGGIGPFVAMDAVQKKYAETAMLGLWAKSDVGQRAQLLRNSSDVKFAAVTSSLQAPLRTEEATPQFQQVAAMYKALGNDTVADGIRGQYFDKDQSDLLGRFNALVEGGLDPATAFQSARVIAPLSASTLDPKDKNEMDGAIRDTVAARNRNIIHWGTQDEQSIRTLQSLVNREVSQRGRGVDSLSGATTQAYARLAERGVIQQIGERTIIGDYSQGTQRPLVALMANPPKGEHPVGQTEFSDAFEEAITGKAKAIGSDLKEYNIIRLPDYGNEARMLVQTHDDKGSPRSFQITTAEVRALAAHKLTLKTPEAVRAKAIASAIPKGAGTGAATTMNAGPGALSVPSPYGQ